MADSRLSQYQRVYLAALSVLGSRYRENEDVRPHFLPEEFVILGRTPRPTSFVHSESDTRGQRVLVGPPPGRMPSDYPPVLASDWEKFEITGEWRKCKAFSRGSRGQRRDFLRDSDLFRRLQEEADVPRSAVLEALRRDTRLNGGRKRSRRKGSGGLRVVSLASHTSGGNTEREQAPKAAELSARVSAALETVKGVFSKEEFIWLRQLILSSHQGESEQLIQRYRKLRDNDPQLAALSAAARMLAIDATGQINIKHYILKRKLELLGSAIGLFVQTDLPPDLHEDLFGKFSSTTNVRKGA